MTSAAIPLLVIAAVAGLPAVAARGGNTLDLPPQGLLPFGGVDAAWGFHVRSREARQALLEHIATRGTTQERRLKAALDLEVGLAEAIGTVKPSVAKVPEWRPKPASLRAVQANISAAFLQTQLSELPAKGKQQQAFVLPIWKVGLHAPDTHSARRLYKWNVTNCTAVSDCGENEYCMSCAKCNEFHKSLSINEQEMWTCDPCDKDEKICESAAYCHVAKDSVDGTCPTELPGCGAHADCRENEYCFSCSECQSKGLGEEYCEPCPTTRGGFCRNIAWCAHRSDAIDGACPSVFGCTSHDDCGNNQYCEGCEQCEAFKATLSPSMAASWACTPCPTTGGGMCEDLRYCQVAKDGIDGSCPMPSGCDHHADCDSGEYCMSCKKCEDYHATLPAADKPKWTCEPCPTEKSGACEMRNFCGVASDAIDGVCPTFQGCSAHTDCRLGSFCMKWSRCEEEIGADKCGAKPTQGGLCAKRALCTGPRSVDGSCGAAVACRGHRDCNDVDGAPSHFCTPWERCMEVSPELCGQQSVHSDGVCLPLEHCVRGLHRPVDGECPALSAPESQADIVATEALRLPGSLQLATANQAMNVWQMNLPGMTGEHVVIMLHDFGKSSKENVENMFDDSEHVGIYKASAAGTLTEERMVDLSCPITDVAVPFTPKHLFETRIARTEFDMSTRHSECSCVVGASAGACPRTVAAMLPMKGKGLEGVKDCVPLTEIDQAESTAAGVTSFNLLAQAKVINIVSCDGVVQLDTDLSFLLKPNLTEGNETFQVRFFRLDAREEEVFLCSGVACDDVKLSFDAHALKCAVAKGKDPKLCGPLPANVSVHAVPIKVAFPSRQVAAYTRTGSKFCAYCLPALTRLHPVLFVDENEIAMENELTVYTVEKDVRATAQLVNSRLAGGEGAPELGCPKLEDEASKGPKLADLKGYDVGHVTNKWCVVKTGGCPLSAKYKLCVKSGAVGVLFVDDKREDGKGAEHDEDKIAYIHVSPGEQLGTMVPAAFTSWDQDLMDSLLQQRPPLDTFAGVFTASWLAGETNVKETGSSVSFSNPGSSSPWDGASGTRNGNFVTITAPASLSGTIVTLEMTNLGYTGHLVQLRLPENKLFIRQEPMLIIGPWVGSVPRLHAEVSRGGVRSYNVQTSKWVEHLGDIGSVHWVQQSKVRPVIFACNYDQTLIMLDASSPDTQMKKLGEAHDDVSCRRRPGFRDYHVVDLKQGDKFFTIEIADGNKLRFYDTTDLAAWKFVVEVHTSWEHESKGLGQVVASHDSEKLFITWHCSTLYCTKDNDEGVEVRPGERLYVLGVDDLAKGKKPEIVGIVQLPLSRGSIIRDIACNKNDICVVGMSWDGVVAVDIGPGLNRYHIIASHSERFVGTDVSEKAAFFRMLMGAQKVYPAADGSNRFYVERWSFDEERLRNDEKAPLSSLIRYDSVWAVSIDGYFRQSVDDLYDGDRQVSASLYLVGAPFQEVLASLPTPDAAFLSQVVHVTLSIALHVDPKKVVVDSVEEFASNEVLVSTGDIVRLEGARIDFRLVTGDGKPPHPEVMYDLLVQQLATPNSALHRGMLKKWMKNAIIAKQDKSLHLKSTQRVDDGRWWRVGVDRTILGFMAFLLVIFMVVTAAALIYASGEKHKASQAKAEMSRLRRNYNQWQQSMQETGDGRGGAVDPATGNVIGRPASEGGAGLGSSAAAYVVGVPMSGSSPAGGVAGGTALSQAEAGKFQKEGAPGRASAAQAQGGGVRDTTADIADIDISATAGVESSAFPMDASDSPSEARGRASSGSHSPKRSVVSVQSATPHAVGAATPSLPLVSGVVSQSAPPGPDAGGAAASPLGRASASSAAPASAEAQSAAAGASASGAASSPSGQLQRSGTYAWPAANGGQEGLHQIGAELARAAEPRRSM